MTWPVLSLAEAHARLTAPGQPFETELTSVRGVPQRVWKHAPATLRDLFVQARVAFGPQDFLVYEGERISFETFARATLALAAQLARLGVQKGDRVVVAMRNLPEWPVAVFATLLLGGIATPLNAWGTGAELAHGLVDAGARLAVLDAERWQRLQPRRGALPQLQTVLVCRGMPDADDAQALAWEALVGPVCAWRTLPAGRLPGVALAPDDDATLLYTSGTTGAAKGALGTHRSSTQALMNGAFSRARNHLRRGEPLPGPAQRSGQQAVLLAVPFFHTTGCQVLLFGALHSGSKLVLMPRWQPEQAMALIEAERITQAGGVPTIAWQLLEHPARHKYDLGSLQRIAYGGAPAPASLVQRLVASLPQAQPATGWGMTETSGTFSHHAAEDYRHRPDSAGPATPVGRMRVCDDSGRALPAGVVGELWVSGPTLVKGYWNRPEETARCFVDGWLRTGDLARLDDEGFLTIVGRSKDMLIRGGENIFCAEVEAVLHRHPAVLDAGVLGRPHPSLGEEPVALVTLKPDTFAAEHEMRAFVRSQIAAFKVPVRIVTSPEPLPRNPNGKLLKPALQQLFQALA